MDVQNRPPTPVAVIVSLPYEPNAMSVTPPTSEQDEQAIFAPQDYPSKPSPSQPIPAVTTRRDGPTRLALLATFVRRQHRLMAVLSGPDFRFTLAPSDARVCILVPSSLRDESACEGLTQAKQVEHMETVARVRHDGWSYATTVASDCATARSFTPATAEKQFAAIAEGMRPSFGPGATMHTGDVTLANGTSVRDVYMTTIDVIFAPPRPAIADLVEHTRGYLFSAGSCTYAVSFTGGAAHAAQIDAEAADAIATLKATEPEANPHAAAYWAGYILAVMLVVIAVGWAFVAALRWKRPTNTE